MHYYGDINNYLAHHGIKGQKWGVRNGPPYPLNQQGDVERKRQFTESLLKELNEEWEYGVLHNGKHVTDTSNFNFGKDYRTTPIETLKKEKIGTCWDFVNYQHYKLNQAGIQNDSYFLDMDLRTKENPNRYITHTFTTYELDGKQYWLESAAWPKRGIHEINSFEDAAKEIVSLYTDDPKPYSLFKYNPDGMDKNLTDLEFADRAREGNWIADYNVKKK